MIQTNARRTDKCFSVEIREVTEGGDPKEDWTSYDPFHGASDDQLTEICDDIYDNLLLASLQEGVDTPLAELYGG